MTDRRFALRTTAPLAGALLVLGLAGCTPPGGETEATGTPEASSTPSGTSSATDAPAPSATTESQPMASGPDGVTYVSGLPTGVSGAPEDAVAGIGWSPDASELYVTVWGSTSCPIIATSFESTDSEITLELVQVSGAVCTQDSTPTTTTLPGPAVPESSIEATATIGDLGQATLPAAADPIAYAWVSAGAAGEGATSEEAEQEATQDSEG